MNDEHESPLLRNAIDAVELGMEDYASQDTRRTLSAVRNFYAGLLLLVKECLSRIAPELIFGKVRPKRTEDGIEWCPANHKTADVDELLARWSALKLPPINENDRLTQLRRLRNELEHREPSVGPEALREAIAATFVIASRIVRDGLGQAPAELFQPQTWETMRSEARVAKDLRHKCRRSRCGTAGAIDSTVGRLVRDGLACLDCGSDLISFVDEEPFPETGTYCEACGVDYSVSVLVEAWAITRSQDVTLRDAYGSCPQCGFETLRLDDRFCLLCLEHHKAPDCLRCGMRIPTEELDTPGGVCSSCYQMAR